MLLKAIGEDIKTIQFGWPLGMPLVEKIQPYLWEVRTKILDGISRVFFTVDGHTMILLHEFIKKSRKIPLKEINTARSRLRQYQEAASWKNNKHIGSTFDDFLQAEGLLAEAEATAVKRVIAYQIEIAEPAAPPDF